MTKKQKLKNKSDRKMTDLKKECEYKVQNLKQEHEEKIKHLKKAHDNNTGFCRFMEILKELLQAHDLIKIKNIDPPNKQTNQYRKKMMTK